ncbi:electron transport complex subunit RsxC [Thalassotalea litorea]|uniref:electron transport complex subunit RsxC n=1 Tax=Thalassotalea litorea TaxID=2020715 RepID=UPI0037367F8C
MESVIERIDKNKFFSFNGGIHPPEQKFLSNDKPIRPLALPKRLVLPVQQHIGNVADILVKPGDKVLKGQPLTGIATPMTVPVHAPTSGTVQDIRKASIAHPSAMAELCIIIEPDGDDKWQPRTINTDYHQLPKADLVAKIAQAGIAGMGGAGFPTNIKVNSQAGVKYLIINAAECEPYITADDLLMREQAATIADGIEILDYMLEPEYILIGIEDNKPQAIQALKTVTKHLDKVRVCVLPTKYPTGGEKQLIKALVGKEVPSGSLPIDLGIIMQNVATVFAIAEAIIHDIPLIRRVVTVTGTALKKPQNVWALLGTEIQHLLNQCGYQHQDQQRIIMGGPMMGFTLPSLQVPVVKITNCILAPTNKEIAPASQEIECIRCGQCAEVCPSNLLPQELQWSAKAKDYDQLEALNLSDCIDCGACAYVCPSHIPLVQYYRVAKAEIKAKKIQEAKSEKAKLRFEARKKRLEKEKLAREEKQRLAAEARKSKAKNTGASGPSGAVAAALARVKAKKAQQDTKPSDATTSPDNNEQEINSSSVKSAAAAAIARAKAKRLAAQKKVEIDAEHARFQRPNDGTSESLQQSPENTLAGTDNDSASASPAVSEKADSKAAAIARIKAKKAAEASVDNAQEKITETSKNSDNEDTKVDAKAAAIARIKAKKAAKAKVDNAQEKITKTSKNSDNEDTKVDAKAAAIARIKAKKAAEAKAEKPDHLLTNETAESSEADKKIDAKAAAIARIKAKKAAEAKAEKPDHLLTNETAESSEADKKIDAKAAAIARIKAKKAATAKPETAEVKPGLSVKAVPEAIATSAKEVVAQAKPEGEKAMASEASEKPKTTRTPATRKTTGKAEASAEKAETKAAATKKAVASKTAEKKAPVKKAAVKKAPAKKVSEKKTAAASKKTTAATTKKEVATKKPATAKAAAKSTKVSSTAKTASATTEKASTAKAKPATRKAATKTAEKAVTKKAASKSTKTSATAKTASAAAKSSSATTELKAAKTTTTKSTATKTKSAAKPTTATRKTATADSSDGKTSDSQNKSAKQAVTRKRTTKTDESKVKATTKKATTTRKTVAKTKQADLFGDADGADRQASTTSAAKTKAVSDDEKKAKIAKAIDKARTQADAKKQQKADS